MPSNTREIKRRIKSISNIRQITRAMQLVATSKMKRAQTLSHNADAYAYGALEILQNITMTTEGKISHPYWRKKDNNKSCLILITTRRGFCGGLNLNLFGEILKFIKKEEPQPILDIITVGKKGRSFAKKIGAKITADFSELADHFLPGEVSPIVRLTTKEYLEKKYGTIYLGFNQFINTLVQKPVIRQLLPISIEAFKEITEADTHRIQKFFFEKKSKSQEKSQYIFEPSIEEVFERLVTHLLEIEVYKALLEARASEHSARMMAMKNATEKAGELINDLRLTYNQARQASITKDIAEISSGAMTTQ